MSVPLWCTLDKCPLDWGYLHYRPSEPGNAFMLAAFAVLIAPALYLGIKHKVHLFTGCFVCGLLGEIAGYAGRLYLYQNPFNENYFLVYLICTTIAPVFTAAAVYLTLARIVVVYGENLSRIRPRTYTLLFSGMDVVALVVQATGGGIAAVGYWQWKIDQGTHIMVAGLAVQVFSLVTFIVLATEFGWRVRRQRGSLDPRYINISQSARFKRFLYALGFATIFLLVRAAFRVAELSGGFAGELAQKEVLFMVLDGAMVLSACILLMVFHPGLAFRGVWAEASFRWGFRKSKRDADSEEDARIESTTANKYDT